MNNLYKLGPDKRGFTVHVYTFHQFKQPVITKITAMHPYPLMSTETVNLS